MESRALPGHASPPRVLAFVRCSVVTTALGLLGGVVLLIVVLPVWISFSVAIGSAACWCAWLDAPDAFRLSDPRRARAQAALSPQRRSDALGDHRGR